MGIATKRCSKCGVEYPATREYFSPDTRIASGLQSSCKKCKREWVHQRRAMNIDKIRERDRQNYAVNPERCRERSLRWKEKNRERLKEYRRQYYSANIDKEREYKRRYSLHNPEKIRARKQRYFAKHRERLTEQSRQYRTVNAELVRERKRQYRSKNAAKIKENNKHYKAKNPDKVLVWNQRREARKRGLSARFTEEDYKRMMMYWGNKCAVCGRRRGDGFIIAADHWIPLNDQREDNPGTVAENMIPLCHARKGSRGGCNNSKHTSDPLS